MYSITHMVKMSSKLHEISSSESDSSLKDEKKFSSKKIQISSSADCPLQIIRGDLFKQEIDSLAHCVSVDLAMGKGIALLFKKKFGGIDELRKQNPQIGGIATLKRGNRFIINLITKEKYWQKPTYDSLQLSLKKALDFAKENKIFKISMPKIGCGLDNLEWIKVETIINNIFSNSGIQISVYVL